MAEQSDPIAESGSNAAVAYRLMVFVIEREGYGSFNDRQSILKLYSQCHKAARGMDHGNISMT